MRGVNHVVITGNVGSRFEDMDIQDGERRFSFDVCSDRRDDKTWITVNVYAPAQIEELRNRLRGGALQQGVRVMIEGSVMRNRRALAVRAETVLFIE